MGDEGGTAHPCPGLTRTPVHCYRAQLLKGPARPPGPHLWPRVRPAPTLQPAVGSCHHLPAQGQMPGGCSRSGGGACCRLVGGPQAHAPPSPGLLPTLRPSPACHLGPGVCQLGHHGASEVTFPGSPRPKRAACTPPQSLGAGRPIGPIRSAPVVGGCRSVQPLGQGRVAGEGACRPGPGGPGSPGLGTEASGHSARPRPRLQPTKPPATVAAAGPDPHAALLPRQTPESGPSPKKPACALRSKRVLRGPHPEPHPARADAQTAGRAPQQSCPRRPGHGVCGGPHVVRTGSGPGRCLAEAPAGGAPEPVDGTSG